MIKKIALILSSIVVIIVIYTFIIGDATIHCPLSHQFRDLSNCEEMYSDDNLTLIQHADLDINEYYFEMIDSRNNSSKFFSFPKDILELGKHGYSVMIDEHLKIKYKILYEASDWEGLNTKELNGHKF